MTPRNAKLALLGIDYESYFLGQDILTEGQHHQRAFLANYLTVGYFEKETLVQLMPNRRISVIDTNSYQKLDPEKKDTKNFVHEAIAHYQYTTNWMNNRPRVGN